MTSKKIGATSANSTNDWLRWAPHARLMNFTGYPIPLSPDNDRANGLLR
jgi:hypothetical protein